MIKSIWSIGEDGSGLGYNVHLTDVAYERIVDSLSKEDLAILYEEEFGGNILVLEESFDSIDNWDSMVKESESFSKPATFDEVLAKVKQVITEYKQYKDD